MVLEKHIPGQNGTSAHIALRNSITAAPNKTPTHEVLLRHIDGVFADECDETFYVAHEDGRLISRLWMGFGKHKDAIGNWGYFFTDPDFRGQGIGGSVLKLWHEDFLSRSDLPLCFLCTTGSQRITEYYGKFGFRPAIEGTTFGPLYMPVSDSPATFGEFCEKYYQPSEKLRVAPATMEFRHEIDCILRFYFMSCYREYGIGEFNGVDVAILQAPERTQMLFSDDGHCVGWGVDGIYRIHPIYEKLKIE